MNSLKEKGASYVRQREKEGLIFMLLSITVFSFFASKMGMANLMSTIMATAYDLLMNTVFYLMAVTVLAGAMGNLLIEFGVVRLLEKILSPLMRPLFALPGVSSLGAVMSFLSDNPAIIALAKNKDFSAYFRKKELISLTNFGTAFGMGLLVLSYMASIGYFTAGLVGFLGAIIGAIVSTRLMQLFIAKDFPDDDEQLVSDKKPEAIILHEPAKGSVLVRFLNAFLDGGKNGVDLGLAIIPGVLVITTAVMLMSKGQGIDKVTGLAAYTGAAYEGSPIIPWIGSKLHWLFKALFGFDNPELLAFPITSLGSVGAALGLLPGYIKAGLIHSKEIAVFTAIGMCWSGYLSTHAAMMDALGQRELTSKAIAAHTIAGIVAGIAAHILTLIFF